MGYVHIDIMAKDLNPVKWENSTSLTNYRWQLFYHKLQLQEINNILNHGKLHWSEASPGLW
jgi:hypothetical protein